MILFCIHKSSYLLTLKGKFQTFIQWQSLGTKCLCWKIFLTGLLYKTRHQYSGSIASQDYEMDPEDDSTAAHVAMHCINPACVWYHDQQYMLLYAQNVILYNLKPYFHHNNLRWIQIDLDRRVFVTIASSHQVKGEFASQNCQGISISKLLSFP